MRCGNLYKEVSDVISVTITYSISEVIFMIERQRIRRRRIGVPRGLLRHLSFQFLKEGPMSGSEIVDKIEEYTDWRPSPGSIYPLLSQMQELGLIRPHGDDDPTLKRFELTEKGRANMEEMLAHGDQMRERNRNIRKLYWKLHTGMTNELYESLREMLDALEDVYTGHKEDLKVSMQLKDALDAATSKIKEIGQ
ncbi:PadR family transcriptional regulator [Candidatus Bathyarchaeota archaeon]|nr:PadR family transcriptional regulator [Candidatus Bathyarchaeota archaeon]